MAGLSCIFRQERKGGGRCPYFNLLHSGRVTKALFFEALPLARTASNFATRIGADALSASLLTQAGNATEPGLSHLDWAPWRGVVGLSEAYLVVSDFY